MKPYQPNTVEKQQQQNKSKKPLANDLKQKWRRQKTQVAPVLISITVLRGIIPDRTGKRSRSSSRVHAAEVIRSSCRSKRKH